MKNLITIDKNWIEERIKKLETEITTILSDSSYYEKICELNTLKEIISNSKPA